MESDQRILLKTILNHILIISLLCILLVRCAQYHWRRRKLYHMAAQRKEPLTLPFIGNVLYFGGSPTDLYNNFVRLSKDFESPVRLWIGQELYFGIWKPNDLETIMNSPHALNKSNLYKFIKVLAGDGLINAAAPKWKRHKKIIMPTMNQKILDGFVELFSEQAEILAQQLKMQTGKGIFDIYGYVSRCSLDTICETAMGIRVNAQTTESEFVEWVNTVANVIIKRMFGVFYYHDFLFNLTSLAKEERDAAKNMNAFVRDVITEKKEEYYNKIKNNKNQPEEQYEEKPKHRKPFLELLTELSEEGEKLTDSELLDEVKNIMIGASETSATTISFLFIMLGMFPNIQRKVYEEVMDVIGPDKLVQYTDLGRLRYLEMVIKETMRIFTIGFLVSRRIDKDIKLESCTVPAGSSVIMFLTNAHRDPDVWQDPLKFDPDRFLPEQIAKRHPYSYVPFLGGLRTCVGPRYALMVMKVMIATIIRKYHFSTDYGSVEDIQLQADLFLKPVNGYKISIELRE